jgi:uncharacterized membrane protein (DUF106 family)
MIKLIIIFVIVIVYIWIAWEISQAPYIDDDGNITNHDATIKSNDTNSQKI